MAEPYLDPEEELEKAKLSKGFSHSSDAVTEKELQSIWEKIYAADTNRAQKQDIVLNRQNTKEPEDCRANKDKKKERTSSGFFTYVNEKLLSKPTYRAFINLLDNYHPRTGQREDFSTQQFAEQDTFLEEVMKTNVMKELYGFLHRKNFYNSREEFVKDLKNMWFGLYSRDHGVKDSSGFEHVFSGEIKHGRVTGFHNWIRLYLQEKDGQVHQYRHIYDGPWNSYPEVLTMHFNWEGYDKEECSAFIGSSPEFEFALYTLCFIIQPDRKCKLKLGGYPLAIQTYTWHKTTYGNGKKYIAAAYVVSSTH